MSNTPTSHKWILELNSRFSIEIEQTQAKELVEAKDAFYRKHKKVSNVGQPGFHVVIIYRINRYLYNKVTAYKNALNTYTLKVLDEYQAVISPWRYKSCLAILMGRL